MPNSPQVGNPETAKERSMMTLPPAQKWSVTMVQRCIGEERGLPIRPRLMLTALARTSTPLSMLALPSLENMTSLWAPRAAVQILQLPGQRGREHHVFFGGQVCNKERGDEQSRLGDSVNATKPRNGVRVNGITPGPFTGSAESARPRTCFLFNLLI